MGLKDHGTVRGKVVAKCGNAATVSAALLLRSMASHHGGVGLGKAKPDPRTAGRPSSLLLGPKLKRHRLFGFCEGGHTSAGILTRPRPFKGWQACRCRSRISRSAIPPAMRTTMNVTLVGGESQYPARAMPTSRKVPPTPQTRLLPIGHWRDCRGGATPTQLILQGIVPSVRTH